MKKPDLLLLSGKILMLLLICTVCACHSPEPDEFAKPEAEAVVYASGSSDLVKRWAPIHYMDVDATGTYSEGGKSDYITAIDYDGDWNAENNWDNLPSYGNALYAHCYYSVVETRTHWFITYAFFHPRDWTDIFFLYELDQHENDLEGVLMIVKKDGSSFGSLQGAVTVSHSDFFSYTTAGSPLYSGPENVDGTLETLDLNGEQHPVTAQEAKGHGLKAWPQYDINGDGVIYYPSMDDNAQMPADNYDTYVEYKLVNIFENDGLWDQRFNTGLFFDAGGGFKGNNFGNGGANAPWAWNDGDDGLVQTGEIATDPAKLTDNYFHGLGDFSHVYVNNPYSSTAGGVATFYQHCDHEGYAVALPAGDYSLGELQSYGIVNDDISSVRIENGYEVTLYTDDGFGGSSTIKTASDNCLGDDGINDEVSSVRISAM